MAGKVSVKERKFLKARIEGKSVAEAAKEAGFNPQYTSVLMKKPEVKAKFSELLDKAGLSDEFLSNKLKQLASAKEKRFFAHEGEVIDEREVEAHGIQLKATELVTKLKGHLVDKQSIQNPDGSPVDMSSRIIVLTGKEPIESWNNGKD